MAGGSRDSPNWCKMAQVPEINDIWRCPHKMKTIVVRFSYVACSCVLLLVLAGCTTRPDYVCPADVFRLRDDQVDRLHLKAEAGDADAAFNLYLHYGAGHGDMVEGSYWLQKAAALGHVMALQHLDVMAKNAETRAKKRAARPSEYINKTETNLIEGEAAEPDIDPFN